MEKPKLAPNPMSSFSMLIKEALIKEYPFKTCINCLHFIETTEVCRLAQARPPARVIAFGCPKYDDDKIPF